MSETLQELAAARERAEQACIERDDAVFRLELAERGVQKFDIGLRVIRREAIVRDDDGRPLNVKQVVDDLIDAHPMLLTPRPPVQPEKPVRGLGRMQQRVAVANQRDRLRRRGLV